METTEDLIAENVPPKLRAFSEWFCNTYGVNGICDPMYVCNVAAAMLGVGDGAGNFGTGLDGLSHYPADQKAKILTNRPSAVYERLKFAYSTCIAQSGNPVHWIRYVIEGLGKQTRRMECACCGQTARGVQWWNRDTGYGLCPNCVDFCHRGISDEDMFSCYGAAGIHYHVKGE